MFFQLAAYCVQKAVGQLVCNIQPKPIRTKAHPESQHPVICADEIQISWFLFVDVGQRVDSPPAVIAVGILLKLIPFPVRALRIPKSAAVSVSSFPVKINAVAASVGKHSVQNHSHPRLMSGVAQLAKVFFRAQQRIDFSIIGSVVPVVGVGFKNRVQI